MGMLYELDEVERKAVLGSATRYDGDYKCEVSESERCWKEASMVYREPFTPSRTPVLACSEHADDLEKQGYEFDEGATVQLARDRERESRA